VLELATARPKKNPIHTAHVSSAIVIESCIQVHFVGSLAKPKFLFFLMTTSALASLTRSRCHKLLYQSLALSD
jgi:hypothetical protein